jgi:tripartite-type tricarboxylate transporter receptor subunit TctC
MLASMRYFALLLILLWPAATVAQTDYPSRPVRIVVGFGPGSAADLTARVLAQRLSRTMGQQFFVENKPGGGVAASGAGENYGVT